jgi:exoribonuclease-2
MLARGLLPDFSAAALEQAGTLRQAPIETGPSIHDLRGLLWASIDNDDSLDLDQLSVAEPLSAGAVKILVAIADVDSAVKAGSAIDEHARINTTSVYTAAQVFPMLPDRLSTDLTSLAQSQERLAVVIEMTIGADSALVQSDIYRALVRNCAKLAYRGVAAWLEGTGPAPPALAQVPGLAQQLRIQDQVAQRLKRVRHERGALSLESSEARPVFDGGLLSDLKPDEKNRAQALIEDLMIAANGVSARFPDLSLSVIKLLGPGEYALERPGHGVEGHFGLAVRDYTHSTAPNRRFPDLLTQRLLKAALAGQPTPYSEEALQDLATHCTEQENNAAKVERQVQKSAAAIVLGPRIGQSFDAIVTGAAAKGTWVRISKPTVEGRVVRGFEGLDVGDRVRVRLVHTDTERGFIDFARTA